MNGLEAATRYGCSHQAPDSCAWCANPPGEEYRVPAALPAGWLLKPEPVAPLWPHQWDTPTSGDAA
jgi:hypothetical protein